jgi:hypothetical protein
MATAVDLPSQVLLAASLKFQTRVGALLWMPEIDYPCLVGRIYLDLSGRFQDGRLIRTSQIWELIDEAGWTIARTFSGSHYLLVQPEDNAFSGLCKLRLMCPAPVGNVH